MPGRVTVRYFTPLRDMTGCDEEALELEEGASLRDLLRVVVKKHRVEPALISNSLVTVNGKGATQLGGLDTELRAGDRVAFLPPISGG